MEAAAKAVVEEGGGAVVGVEGEGRGREASAGVEAAAEAAVEEGEGMAQEVSAAGKEAAAAVEGGGVVGGGGAEGGSLYGGGSSAASKVIEEGLGVWGGEGDGLQARRTWGGEQVVQRLGF